MENKDYTMTVGQLIKKLKEFKPTAQVLVSCDEELNTLFKGFDVTNIKTNSDPTGENTIVFYGLDGLEFEDDDFDEEISQGRGNVITGVKK